MTKYDKIVLGGYIYWMDYFWCNSSNSFTNNSLGYFDLQ